MASDRETEESVRRAYESDGQYSTATICRTESNSAHSYVDGLVSYRLNMVRQYAQPGTLLDLCCATGEHLLSVADFSERCIGIDFSQRFISKAHAIARKAGRNNVFFIAANARALPIQDDTISTLYCFSSLYQVPGIEQVFKDIARVLKPGGRCILDLGNKNSLNAVCLKYYPELPPSSLISVPEMRRIANKHSLAILEHRSFQLLPLWAGRPWWLKPLLHSRWNDLMRRRFRGRMLDEWISSAPVLRRFSFRHLLVCEKAK